MKGAFEKQLFDELRSDGGDNQSITDLCIAITDLGYTSFGELYSLSNDAFAELLFGLEEKNINLRTRRAFKAWLQDLQSKPPRDSPAKHFYGLKEALNHGDASGLNEATILRVIIDSRIDIDDKQAYSFRVPPGVIDAQVQKASSENTPIVSMLGPTGSGKSFLANTFMSHFCTSSERPVVAVPNQSVPTSANVCFYRGEIHPNCSISKPIALIDFEGEDGQTPKNLIGEGRKQWQQLKSLLPSSDENKSYYQALEARRNKVIKHELPTLAYLISDVIVFIDTVEPRRTERIERIRSFAVAAHKSVEGKKWQPALIIIQNKWICEGVEIESFDVTDEYEWITESLSGIFSRVSILRIPTMSKKNTFENSLLNFHDAVKASIEEMRKVRKLEGPLYSEREFWVNFPYFLDVMNERSPDQYLTDYDTIVMKNRHSEDPKDNATRLLSMFGNIPQDGNKFRTRVDEVLKWYAYALAGEAKYKDEVHIRKCLRTIYDKILEQCLSLEPCTALRYHEGGIYPCTQRRSGHGSKHKNPSMLKVERGGVLKKIFGFSLFKDEVPCIWEGDMDATDWEHKFDKFQKDFDACVKEDDLEYQKASRALFDVEESKWMTANTDGFCALCLRSGQDLSLLPEKKKHPLCKDCIWARKVLSQKENQVVCPFCHQSCIVDAKRPDKNRLRILSLDGGGARCLFEISTLKRLEERFAPLSTTSLFDLIVGTGTGGVIAMALLTKTPLNEIENFMKHLVSDILQISSFKICWNKIMQGSECDTAAYRRALRNLFGENKNTEYFKKSMSPYIFCATSTSINGMNESKVGLHGNFPPGWKRSTDFLTCDSYVWEAAYSTASSPPFFGPREHKETKDYSKDVVCTDVDGGILSNCPAGVAIRLARELQIQLGSMEEDHIEMIASIGTGALAPSTKKSDRGDICWGKYRIDFALESEKIWQEEIVEDKSLKDVPKIRLNPPNLGSIDPFVNTSLESLQQGIQDFFSSHEGDQMMSELYDIIFSKLWCVPQESNPIVGEEIKLHIDMHEDLLDFSSKNDDELREMILQRSYKDEDDLKNMSTTELIHEAKDHFLRKPFVPPLEGEFVYSIGSHITVLGPDERTITFPCNDVGLVPFNVVWRSKNQSEIPISGFPRFLRVIGACNAKFVH